VDACVGSKVVQVYFNDWLENVKIKVDASVSLHASFKKVINDVMRANRTRTKDMIQACAFPRPE